MREEGVALQGGADAARGEVDELKKTLLAGKPNESGATPGAGVGGEESGMVPGAGVGGAQVQAGTAGGEEERRELEGRLEEAVREVSAPLTLQGYLAHKKTVQGHLAHKKQPPL